MKVFIGIILVSLLIVAGVSLSEKIGEAGAPKIVNDDFSKMFSDKQVYYLENEPIYFSDGAYGLLLSKTDNDFGQGNGEYYAIAYNPKETRFYRVSEDKVGETLRAGNLVINRDGKFNKYQPVITPFNKT